METSPERIEPAGSVLAKVPTFSSAVLLMVLVVVSWASATVASKHLYLSHLITPLSLVVLRFTLAGSLSLAIFAALKLRRRQTKRVQMVKQIQVENVDETTGWPLVGSWRVYLFGGSLITLFITGYNLALVHISASLGGLVFFGITPLVMLVAGHFWLGTPLGVRHLVGMMVALTGISLVVVGGDWQQFIDSLRGSNLLLGLSLMIASAVGWGMYGLWGKRYSRPGASLLSTGFNQLIGVTPVWLLWLLLEPNGFANLQPEAWLYILYIGVVPSALGFALFYAILKDLSVNQAATVQLLSPVITELLAFVFLSEPLGLTLIAGTLILLLGVRMITTAQPSNKVKFE